MAGAATAGANCLGTLLTVSPLPCWSVTPLQCIREKMDVIDLEDESIDAEVGSSALASCPGQRPGQRPRSWHGQRHGRGGHRGHSCPESWGLSAAPKRAPAGLASCLMRVPSLCAPCLH